MANNYKFSNTFFEKIHILLTTLGKFCCFETNGGGSRLKNQGNKPSWKIVANFGAGVLLLQNLWQKPPNF